MKKSGEKFLFIIPTASINGAIILLMHFYDYLLEHSKNTEIETIVQWGKGDNPDAFFRNKLLKYGSLTFLQELSENDLEKLKERILNEDIDMMFFNSIISIETQLFFIEKKCKKIFYVHEMERLMNVFNLKAHTNFYIDENNYFLAGSESVKDALKNVFGLANDRITVVHSFINPETIKNQIKKTFEINHNKYIDYKDHSTFTIGLTGTFELRKSADLLLPLVAEIKKRIKKTKIYWIGAEPFNGEPGTFDMVMHDVKMGGFENDITFIPKSLDYIKYNQQFDVYVLLSREDPFPLAIIEMGVLGVPIICFENSGGAPDYAKLGGGIAVPFMDLGAIADKILEFYSNPKLLESYKQTGPILIENNFSIKVQAPKLLNMIRNFNKEK